MFTYHINEKAKEKILSDISGIRSGGEAEQMTEMLKRFPETARGIDLRILEENADNELLISAYVNAFYREIYDLPDSGHEAILTELVEPLFGCSGKLQDKLVSADPNMLFWLPAPDKDVAIRTIADNPRFIEDIRDTYPAFPLPVPAEDDRDKVQADVPGPDDDEMPGHRVSEVLDEKDSIRIIKLNPAAASYAVRAQSDDGPGWKFLHSKMTQGAEFSAAIETARTIMAENLSRYPEFAGIVDGENGPCVILESDTGYVYPSLQEGMADFMYTGDVLVIVSACELDDEEAFDLTFAEIDALSADTDEGVYCETGAMYSVSPDVVTNIIRGNIARADDRQETLIEDKLVAETKNVRVFIKDEVFTAGAFFSPEDGRKFPATVSYDTEAGTITVALSKENWTSARDVAEGLWGDGIEGGAHFACSPEGRQMTRNDLVKAVIRIEKAIEPVADMDRANELIEFTQQIYTAAMEHGIGIDETSIDVPSDDHDL